MPLPPKPKVLLIDPDAAAREQLAAAMAVAEVQARPLAAAKPAVELIEREKFDGIFVDWAVSDIPAAKLVSLIRHSKPNYAAPIIAMGRDDEPKTMKESFQEGVTFFLGKPLNPSKIQRLLAVTRGMILEERRHFQRAPVSLPADCQCNGEEIGATIVEMSARGVLLRAKKIFAANSELRLRFQLPTAPGSAIQTAAEVVRETPQKEMAVRFVNLAVHERNLIADFVESSLGKQPPPTRLAL